MMVPLVEPLLPNTNCYMVHFSCPSSSGGVAKVNGTADRPLPVRAGRADRAAVVGAARFPPVRAARGTGRRGEPPAAPHRHPVRGRSGR